MNNIQNSLERIEKRLVSALTTLIIFSLLLIYLVFDAFVSYYRIKYYEELENINLDLLTLETQKNLTLDIIENTLKQIDETKQIKVLDSLSSEYKNLIILRKRLIKILKGNKNILDFDLNENGEYVYITQEEVNKFWNAIDKKQIPIFHETLKESINGINFKSLYDELNTSKSGFFKISKDKELLHYETVLKMQNYFASIKEIDHRIEIINNMDFKRIDIKSVSNDDPELAKYKSRLENYYSELKEINSKIKKSLKLQISKIDSKGRNEIKSKNHQTITLGNISLSIQTIPYFYPIALTLIFHWILLNLKRFEYLLSFLKGDDIFYSNMFLNYSGKFSGWTTFLIIMLPLFTSISFYIYILIFSDYFVNYQDLFLFKKEALNLILLSVAGFIISYIYIIKIINSISKISKVNILK
ncbi:hypothetical protein [Leptospira brenneri]|uniref:hypothetical protein n=1 Tax=Leptospira brenneri TaxID=2023182 RepID=UPI000C29C3AC|nr:hypothetical protein [Leptospira brenneri]PJZ43761.1 hypothetical protein CH361_18585 [Leptospira brenneri]